jgi:hypothetical protein
MQEGVSQEYYNQRIEIYQYVLGIVDKVRGNFCSSNMVDFEDRIRGYIRECNTGKEELREAEEWSARLKYSQDLCEKWMKERREMIGAVIGLLGHAFESQQRMLDSYTKK